MDNKCEKCGRELEVGMYPFCKGSPEQHGAFRQTHGDTKSYPKVVTHFNGKPILVTDAAHDRRLQKEYGVVLRDDVAFTEKTYEGYNGRTKRQEYREGSGMGLPGCWFALTAFLLWAGNVI